MDITQFRIRIDVAIARKAEEMAQALGMELPDVIRMMLTKAVRIGHFSIEREIAEQQAASNSNRPYYDYDERQWNSMKAVLDAELALALVNQYVAYHTLQLEAAFQQGGEPDEPLLDRLTRERDEARKILATLDPTDRVAVRSILQRFTEARDLPEQNAPGRDEGGSP
jgi:antitoxin component of RelBE/YafQ-DinJ toxin-antitoxin module